MLEGARHEIRFEAPCHCGAHAAALKSAYLAACALAPVIVTEPERWPLADEVRCCLWGWRDAVGHLAQPSLFKSLHVRYTAPPADTLAGVPCEATHRDSGERRQVLRLGWQLVTDWPVDAASVSYPVGAQTVIRPSR